MTQPKDKELQIKPQNKPDIFTLMASDENVQQAVKSLITGRTPAKEIKTREGRGGRTFSYVNTYYMTHQIGLITGFRWSSECLEEKAYPNWENPRELGAQMKITIYDAAGNAYSHTSWGQKDVGRYTKSDPKNNPPQYKAGDIISIFDDLKAAYSDGIKKSLSYFGIASDIYGGKEPEYFMDDSTNLSENDANREFSKYVDRKGLLWSRVFEILGVQDMEQITDYKAAYFTLKNKLEGGDASPNNTTK